MPTYRSINLALHSQFDIETIPEYYPPPVSPPASSPSSTCVDLSSATIPPLTDDTTSTVSVHIPILAGSQFWLAYSVSPPVPDGHYFFFKLYIDGQRVVSWATGREDGWRGKMMFGLFENEGKVEKRVLCFGKLDGSREKEEGGVLTVRVHRASRRRRVERATQIVGEIGRGGGGVRLVSAGRAGPEQPKRFYRFQLIDPVDQPFATFRYYYRSWERLRDLGLLDQEHNAESEEGEMSVIEPGEIIHNEPEDIFHVQSDRISVHDWSETKQKEDAYKQLAAPPLDPVNVSRPSSYRDSITSGSYRPHVAPSSEISTGSPPPLRHDARNFNRRLSVPPSIKFDAPAPESRPLPVPPKNNLTSTAYRPHPAYPVEEQAVRTPSPSESVRDGVATPATGRKGLRIMGAGLMGFIQSTWKRSVSAAQPERKKEIGEGQRSVSY